MKEIKVVKENPCDDCGIKGLYDNCKGECVQYRKYYQYQQGRADKYQEITSEYMLLTEKQVAEIRADAIDEIIEWLKTNPKYATSVSSDCVEEVNSKIVEYYEHIVQQLNELKGQK